VLIFSTSAFFCLIGFLLTLLVKEEPKRISVPPFPFKIIVKNLNVYLPFLIRHSAAQAIWAIFPIYLNNLGANKFQIGAIYTINPLAQFIFMLILDRYKSSKLITMGIFCSALTFLGYAVSPSWQVILFLQILLGLSWASLYLGSVKYLLENNLEQATATGFLSSVSGLSGIIGPIIGGPIVLLGLRPLLFGSSIIAATAFIFSLRFKKEPILS